MSDKVLKCPSNANLRTIKPSSFSLSSVLTANHVIHQVQGLFQAKVFFFFFFHFFLRKDRSLWLILHLQPDSAELRRGTITFCIFLPIIKCWFPVLFKCQLSGFNLPPPRGMSGIILRVVTAIYYVNWALISLTVLLLPNRNGNVIFLNRVH